MSDDQKQFDDLLRQLDVVSSRFARSMLDHWYIYTVGMYILLFLLSMVWDRMYARYLGVEIGDFPASIIDYLSSGQIEVDLYPWLQTTHGVLTNYGLSGWLGGISIIIVIYNRWRKKAPAFFRGLLTSKNISSWILLSDRKYILASAIRYLRDYRKDLHSRKRFWIFGALALIILLLDIAEGPSRYLFEVLFRPDISRLALYNYFISVLMFPVTRLMTVYFGCEMLWSIYITGKYINRISSTFKLNVEPYHPDHCGGLKSLGIFCLEMALTITIMGLFLVAYGTVTLIWFPQYSGQVLAAYLSTFLFIFPLAILAFFVPLWRLHDVMVQQKYAYFDQHAAQLADIENRIHFLITDNKLPQVEAAIRTSQLLQTHNIDEAHYPVWPFDLNILLRFWSPQILSFAVSLGSLILTA